jgi:hypothetical protein
MTTLLGSLVGALWFCLAGYVMGYEDKFPIRSIAYMLIGLGWIAMSALAV